MKQRSVESPNTAARLRAVRSRFVLHGVFQNHLTQSVEFTRGVFWLTCAVRLSRYSNDYNAWSE